MLFGVVATIILLRTTVTTTTAITMKCESISFTDIICKESMLTIKVLFKFRSSQQIHQKNLQLIQILFYGPSSLPMCTLFRKTSLTDIQITLILKQVGKCLHVYI